MKEISVTTIIPMYNSEDTIAETIDSVFEQTWKGPIEVLIINDGSTDSSESIVKNYIQDKKADNITIRLINKNNGGVSTARNVGIKEARGQWIALLDSDDIWLPKKLEKQMKVLEDNPDIKFLGSNRNNEVYPFFGKSKLHLYSLTTKEVLFKWWPSTPTVIFKKEVVATVGGYDEALKGAEDGEFWLRVLTEYEIYILNESLVLTGHGKRSFGEKGLSADLYAMHLGEKKILRILYKKKQINCFEYLFFYSWFLLKYMRRKLIVRVS
ncbi:glycosyltransferase family 2 protein [Vibrio aestuarianus]|uniref:Glycosyltransferase family 2 protein n=1 Tax=Vibrio aestuarianus TaxID=28171 RepID=A0A9X4EVF1_9VIBR|nr:glycosyltransferase family A protein [Vibrio aestuarianus]MDE1234351.1 glycosyltransferase family 2 protein [Vibrio aestuarianus]MDE1243127.1 glycosyltransferase family 2 protein [Vibrio aestuarianus]MDE1245203.1 glycosyltransferase family 2 protein [Vibrio aestuarianus]NGZ64412.1 glycosyltransferase family 2 protein [Vibrio aestuarianus subsp. cardii]NGZ66711.1 glycosyltransferase family 2 protein [Vibrio aestuarianus subsp. cardii]